MQRFNKQYRGSESTRTACAPEGCADNAQYPNKLSGHFRDQFLKARDLIDLDEAIRFGQLAVDTTTEDHIGRAQILTSLGTCFGERFLTTGDLKDLEESIQLVQLAVDTILESYPNYTQA